MLFNSWQYVAFLPLVAILYFLLPHKFRWVLLLCASYYFYMSWNSKLVFLILATTITSYVSALCIQKAKTPAVRKAILCLGAGASLSTLFFFKYFNFFSVSVTQALRKISLPVDDFTVNVMLPVGISFYTFQTLSYIIDVYNGKLKAERHFGIFALYVSFFPQLVAGPIERAVNLLPQFYQHKKPNADNIAWGLRMIAWGMFKKVAIADVLALSVNKVYEMPGEFSATAQLLATIFFAFQIYCDFSGYSDIALGSAKILGFDLMENFKSPYFAFGMRAFWRRWHISLSTWMSDYIYIPLGGSRCKPLRQAFNLAVTFLISGLWHGASWNFVVWGAVQGFFVILDTFTQNAQKNLRNRLKSNLVLKIYNFAGILVTFIIVCYSWTFFRADTLSTAIGIIKAMTYSLAGGFIKEGAVAINSMGLTVAAFVFLIAKIAVLLWFDFKKQKHSNMFETLALQKPILRRVVTYTLGLVALIAMLLVPENAVVDFIYFQF